MKNILTIALVSMLSINTLTACHRQDVGMVAGGVGGAVVGNVITGGSGVGTAIGAIGGAFAGRELSR